jgi:hypothetical protein
MKNIKLIIATVSSISLLSFTASANDLQISKTDIKQEIEISLANDTSISTNEEVKNQFKTMLANANLKSSAAVYLTSLSESIKTNDSVTAED